MDRYSTAMAAWHTQRMLDSMHPVDLNSGASWALEHEPGVAADVRVGFGLGFATIMAPHAPAVQVDLLQGGSIVLGDHVVIRGRGPWVEVLRAPDGYVIDSGTSLLPPG